MALFWQLFHDSSNLLVQNCGIIHIYIVAFLDVCDICLAILTKRIFMILYFSHFLLILQVKKRKRKKKLEMKNW